MTKKSGGNNLHLLDNEQQAALRKYAKDFHTALPHMQNFAQHAQRLHQEMIKSPFWRVAETPKPDGVQEDSQEWSVGHAQVNYVDHIETEGTQSK